MAKKTKPVRTNTPSTAVDALISGKTLMAQGWQSGPAIGVALSVAKTLEATGESRSDILALLDRIRTAPEDFREGDYAQLAALVRPVSAPIENLRDTPVPSVIFGRDLIESSAIDQLEVATRLPVAVRAALMPDAHSGYGLPIGGVLAVDNAVIPYAVGVDIGCRMHMGVYRLPPQLFQHTRSHRDIVAALESQTVFGKGKGFVGSGRADHAVMESLAWGEQKLLRTLKNTAWAQLGSSGSGNHFVDVGKLKIDAPSNALGLEAGDYIAILSHSGSRGLGANIADHFTTLARLAHPKLPESAKYLAWLNMDSEEGQAYWKAMTLAGEYAKANHEIIHQRLAEALGWEAELVLTVQNHHNFAWREQLEDGRAVYVHRKGATPAGAGVLGIIPGSMTTEAQVVVGKGNADALHSASHGAGRKASRTAAKAATTPERFSRAVKEAQVTLLGGALDEGSHAYKDIKRVIAAQSELVDVVATFTPRYVKMASEEIPAWRKRKK